MKIQKKDQILKLLAENGMMKAGDFAERFQVSMETIRRDLTELEESTMIRRVHGGAILYTEYSKFAGHICYSDTPGAGASNLKQFKWKNIPEGMYPFGK